eukprot:gene22720-36524_t
MAVGFLKPHARRIINEIEYTERGTRRCAVLEGQPYSEEALLPILKQHGAERDEAVHAMEGLTTIHMEFAAEEELEA